MGQRVNRVINFQRKPLNIWMIERFKQKLRKVSKIALKNYLLDGDAGWTERRYTPGVSTAKNFYTSFIFSHSFAQMNLSRARGKLNYSVIMRNNLENRDRFFW